MRETLSAIPGVKSADVNFERKEAEVTYDKGKVTLEDIAKQLSDRTNGKYTATAK